MATHPDWLVRGVTMLAQRYPDVVLEHEGEHYTARDFADERRLRELSGEELRELSDAATEYAQQAEPTVGQ
jgi:hypothetical protein